MKNLSIFLVLTAITGLNINACFDPEFYKQEIQKITQKIRVLTDLEQSNDQSSKISQIKQHLLASKDYLSKLQNYLKQEQTDTNPELDEKFCQQAILECSEHIQYLNLETNPSDDETFRVKVAQSHLNFYKNRLTNHYPTIETQEALQQIEETPQAAKPQNNTLQLHPCIKFTLCASTAVFLTACSYFWILE